MPYRQMNDLDNIANTLELVPIPAFTISVEDNNTFRFLSINQALMNASGLHISHVQGKTPEEFFPPRLAESIVANYVRCVEEGEQINYLERLCLPNGEATWETALSPIFKDGKITGIIGVSHDMTEAHDTEKRLALQLEQANQTNIKLKNISDTFVNDLSIPLREASQLSEKVLDGFEDLGDNKLAMLEKNRTIIENAITRTQTIINSALTLQDDQHSSTNIDFGRWCMEVIAIVDPLKKFDFFFPQISLECEKFILDIALRNLIDVAVENACSRISMDVIEVGDQLVFNIENDGINIGTDVIKSLRIDTTESGTNSVVASAKNLVEARGGALWIEQDNDANGNSTIALKIFGSMINPSKKYMYMHAA